MRIFLLTLASLTLFTLPALANHTEGHKSIHTTTVNVNGLVCDFCARAIEKVFYKQEGVEGVIVNLDEQKVTLETDDTSTLTDEQISALITEAGYNVVSIKHDE